MAQTCVTPLVARHSLPVRHRRHRRHRHRRQPPSGQPAQFKRQCASILAQMRVRVGETLACGNHKVIKSCLHSKLRRITSQSSGCRDVVIASAASKYTMPLISSHFISWTKENLASPRVEQTDPMCDLGLHHQPPIARYPANHSPQTARSVSLSPSLSLCVQSLHHLRCQSGAQLPSLTSCPPLSRPLLCTLPAFLRCFVVVVAFLLLGVMLNFGFRNAGYIRACHIHSSVHVFMLPKPGSSHSAC